MSLEDGARPPVPRGGVRFSARVAGAICRRVAGGETLLAICRDVDMPSSGSVRAWVRQNPRFAQMYQRAKVFGGRTGRGRPARWCPMTAHEIVVRVSEGEALSDIADDPAMPSLRTILRWQTDDADFAAAMEAARWAQAERLGDLGWKMALAATPETAWLTRVQLGQLRWMAGIKAPRVFGRMKAVEPPAEREVQLICFRHFKIETHPETGQHRVVSYCPDPDTMLPERDSVGPWTDPVDPVAKMAELERLSAERRARDGRGCPA